jgi:valyl-tRNA synthetase
VTTARSAARAVYDSVQLGRNLRAAARVPSNKKAEFVLRPTATNGAEELPTVARLLNAEQITIDRNYKAAAGVPVAITPLGDLHLIVSGGDRAAEAERLDKEIGKTENELRTVGQKLANRAFAEKAPPAVVEEHERRKADFAAKLAQLRQARAALD